MRRNCHPFGGINSGSGSGSGRISHQDKCSCRSSNECGNGNGGVIITNGGSDTATSTTSNTTSNRRRRRKQNGGGIFSISLFQNCMRRPSSEDEKTYLLIVIMCVLAFGLLHILYQICLALSVRRHAHHNRSSWPGGGHHEKGITSSFPNLPFNPNIYRIPEAHDQVGDRSDRYARLRQQVDTVLPINDERSLLSVHQLRLLDISNPHHDHGNNKDGKDKDSDNSYSSKIRAHVMDPLSEYYQNYQDGDLINEPYDVYNCPDVPPRGYPFQWNLVHEILHDWPVNDYRIIPNQTYNGLCIFDYNKDYKKALRYRRAEQPFVVDHDPQVARTVERWAMIPNYMEQMMGKDVLHRAEYNTNNHFLYSIPQKQLPSPNRQGTRQQQQQQPLELQDLHGRPAKLQNQAASPNAIRMTYHDWLNKANVTTSTTTLASASGPNDEHWYFRLVGCGYMGPDGSCDKGSSEYLFDELPYLQPHNDTLYMGDGSEQKGIHCRFGMQGVLAENHFDGSRNTIVVLRGMRRYILSHPNQCDKLTLLPMGHTSARHSAVDYTQPDLQLYPEFEQAMANEVVLQAGQVLYLPTNWFHYIVSLNLNMQCNARSGETDHYKEPIKACGF